MPFLTEYFNHSFHFDEIGKILSFLIHLIIKTFFRFVNKISYFNLFFVSAIDVQSILNLELEPTTKPLSISTPSFATIGSSDLQPKSSPSPPPPPPPDSPPPHPASPPITLEESAEESQTTVETSTPQEVEAQPPVDVEDISNTEDSVITKDDEGENSSAPNLFYTPDEEETCEETTAPSEPVFEESESVSYVPPFNNPIYPNDSFTSYTSAIGK